VIYSDRIKEREKKMEIVIALVVVWWAYNQFAG
jgi:hypothetical protein